MSRSTPTQEYFFPNLDDSGISVVVQAESREEAEKLARKQLEKQPEVSTQEVAEEATPELSEEEPA